MNWTAFLALARRDIRIFFLDRRAVVMSFVAPILIASFFGFIFGGNRDAPASKVEIASVDQDGSAISQKIVASLNADAALHTQPMALEPAREAVRGGKITVAAVIPPGFGDNAARALLRAADKPEIKLLYDPSHNAEVQMVRGMLAQHVIETVSNEAFNGSNSRQYLDDARRDLDKAEDLSPADRQALRDVLTSIAGLDDLRRQNPKSPVRSGLNMPYSVNEEAVTAHHGTPYNGMAHSFAGMAVQFILVMGIDAGIVVLMQRSNGLWKRLQAAPISRFTVIGSRTASAAAISALILAVVFGFARVVFGVKVEGSFAGFLGVCAAFSLMTATFGLLIAVLGKTPEATRGIAILVTLILVMLGGSWIPTFLFPQWMQNATLAVPTRWAVDGLDGMLWRGLAWNAAVPSILALLGFAVLFGAIAVWRFRWD